VQQPHLSTKHLTGKSAVAAGRAGSMRSSRTPSGLARNFGDVFGAGSGSERAVGVIVGGGDTLE